MMVDDDDGPPQLSAETLKALQEWREEQERNQAAGKPEEDWVSSIPFFARFNLFGFLFSN